MDAKFDFRQALEEHKGRFLTVILGLFLLGVGALSFIVLSLQRSEPQIEVISSSQPLATEGGEIVVDVAGAVEKPGVYRLASGARVNDALLVAGGISAEADREWLTKYINLAQILSDGIKVYIPKVGEIAEGTTPLLSETKGEVIGLTKEHKINLNTASLSELDSLWGVGAKRAQTIVDKRPYSSVEQLLEKRIVPSNVFERIKDEISVQ